MNLKEALEFLIGSAHLSSLVRNGLVQANEQTRCFRLHAEALSMCQTVELKARPRAVPNSVSMELFPPNALIEKITEKR